MVRVLVLQPLYNLSDEALEYQLRPAVLPAFLWAAAFQQFRKAEKDILAEDAIPADWTPAQRCQKDTQASWTKKHGKSHHGYKLSISADGNTS